MHSLDKLFDIAEKHGIDVQWAEDYAEPGYDTPENGIVFADWNDKTEYNRETREHTVIDDAPSRLAVALERTGCAIEWSDEWSVCEECCRAVRTQPNSYCWLPAYKFVDDCSIVCKDCLLEDLGAYAETLEGNHDVADTFDVDWILEGYTQVGPNYETGFHPGQDDSPNDVADSLRAQGYERFLFQIKGTGQFDTTWCVFVHDDDLSETDGE